MEFLDIIQIINSRGIMPQKTPNLNSVHEALKRIFPPTENSHFFSPEKTILVAGTNGKGSVCSTLETLLLNAGQKVGMYTSPHLESIVERFRIQGENITSQLFTQAFLEIESKTSDLKLSHFETLTIMAAWIFYSKKNQDYLDWVIFEVGMGGLWDATNAIPHHYSIITSLGFDHEKFLGNTLIEIASNKFGIVSPNSKVIHSSFPDELQTLVQETKKRTLSDWYPSTPFSLRIDQTQDEPIFFIKTLWGEARLALPGKRAAQNTATALTAFWQLGFEPKNHLEALKNVHWPGRMEKILIQECPCPIYLSGDHNPQGVDSLIELLSFYKRKHLHIVIGIGAEKNINEMLGKLFSLPDCSIYLTETPYFGASLKNYGQWLHQARAVHSNPLVLLTQVIKSAQDHDLILVTGSLYLVGQIRQSIHNLNFS